MSLRRKFFIWIASVLWIALVCVIAWPRIDFYLLTGRISPVQKIERLNSPVQVVGWSSDGFDLMDGRKVQLPGFVKLPNASTALAEATKRGIEVDQNGRVFGLVQVHHWCGNDPVREHIAKVDIANLLAFLGEGETAPSSDNVPTLTLNDGGDFSEWGWNVSQFSLFEATQASTKAAASR
jgi:hypothetical protein